MQWHSLSDFLAMGGYAVYVWGSVGACVVAMVAEPWLLRRHRRRILRSMRPARGSAGGARFDTPSTEGTR